MRTSVDLNSNIKNKQIGLTILLTVAGHCTCLPVENKGHENMCKAWYASSEQVIAVFVI